MDPRLLQHYNLELQHLREMGAEFALQFPKIAARLGMSGLDVADPYVERLLEGVAFLAARVQLKLDAEFPRFTQALLELIHPHYVAPTPAMLVAQLRPDRGETGLLSGFTVRRGSGLHALAGADSPTTCEFHTAQDVTLWPLEVAAASYFTFAPDLPLNAVRTSRPVRGGLRIRLRTTAGVKASQMALDRLPLYLTGREDVANALYELSLASGLGVLVQGTARQGRWHAWLPPDTIRPLGFDDEQALLPVTGRGYHGYRLLQEYFAFPQRFRFVELTGLAPVVARADGDELEIVLLFDRGQASLEHLVDGSNVALGCTPAVNLFARRLDRIHVSERTHEYQVVADRTRPLDFEVYDVTRVTGHGSGSEGEQEFRPFYAEYGTDPGDGPPTAFYTLRREPRLVSTAEKRRGPRSSYVGSEVFLSLVDARQAPFSGSLRQLALEARCTNRDLVLQMPVGAGRTDASLDAAAPVEGVRVVSGPSRPFGPLADGALAWRAISHLSLNYLSLVDGGRDHDASALRELLELYAPVGDAVARRQIEGLRSVRAGSIVRRIPPPRESRREADRRLAFGRGLEIGLEVDELAFEGGSAFLLGSVLARYFARHVSTNGFTETVLRSSTRGEIHRWEAQWGERPTL